MISKHGVWVQTSQFTGFIEITLESLRGMVRKGQMSLVRNIPIEIRMH